VLHLDLQAQCFYHWALITSVCYISGQKDPEPNYAMPHPASHNYHTSPRAGAGQAPVLGVGEGKSYFRWSQASNELEFSWCIGREWGGFPLPSWFGVSQSKPFVYTSPTVTRLLFLRREGRISTNMEWSWPLSTGCLYYFYRGERSPHWKLRMKDSLNAHTRKTSLSCSGPRYCFI